MLIDLKDQSLHTLFNDLASRQKPMGEAFNRIIFENIEDLYEDEAPANHKEVRP